MKVHLMRTPKLALILATYFSLSACNYLGAIPGASKVVGDDGVFRDRQGDYLDAETIPRTEVPAGLDSYVLDDLLVVPDVEGDNVESFLEIPRPRAMSGRSERGVVIQRMDDESWIVVDASASQVWPRVRDFWASSGIGLASENPTAGVLDTQWFILENNVLTREKVRVTVEPGFQDNSSEIKLLHLSSAQATPIDLVPDRWGETSADPELEYDILTQMSSYLADVADLYQATSVSFLAGNIPNEGKASITTDGAGGVLLRLDADYARSWAAVSRALTRAGIEIMAEDRSLGTLEVSYSVDHGESDEQSLFGKVVTLNGLLYEPNDDPGEIHSLQIQLLDKDSSIDVFIESLEPASERSESVEQAKESLLRAIRNFIA